MTTTSWRPRSARTLRVRLERYHGDRADQFDHVGRETGIRS
ncbi:hypothetical protein ACFFX0_14735 [Citricoccus parietis]|uniref:Uncharacterized protein n=1 Tax=Citricoccus parietis TaxID=592307 RepID=A0ABV5G0B7_9MICC